MFVSVGANEPETIVPLGSVSGSITVDNICNVLRKLSGYSMALFGAGLSLSHYGRERISCHEGMERKPFPSSKTISGCWSGNTGYIVTIKYETAEVVNGKTVCAPFPIDVYNKLLELRQDGKIPGNIIIVGKSKVVILFITTAVIWDNKISAYFGMMKNSEGLSPSAQITRSTAAANGAIGWVTQSLYNGFEGMKHSFAVEHADENGKPVCIPAHDGTIESCVVRQGLYDHDDFKKYTLSRRYNPVLDSPTSLVSLIGARIEDA